MRRAADFVLCATLVVACSQCATYFTHKKGLPHWHTHTHTHQYTYKLFATLGACSTVLRFKIFPFWQGKYFCKTELNRFCFTAPIAQLIFFSFFLFFCFLFCFVLYFAPFVISQPRFALLLLFFNQLLKCFGSGSAAKMFSLFRMKAAAALSTLYIVNI